MTLTPGSFRPFNLPRIGEPGHGGIVIGDHLAEIDRRRLDLLVLAELAVAGVEVVEAQALEHLQIAGDGLRIVHGRGDEIVEIDVLDIEGPPHMGAAFFQDLRHGQLIPRGIEARPDRLRIDENLAQGQGGREDLDEDCAHSAAVIGSLHST